MNEVEEMHESPARPSDAENASKDIGLQEMVEEIKDALQDFKQKYLKIGWSLKYIKEAKLYKEKDFNNINEFAAHYFGLSQSSVSRFINICEEFSVGDRPELMPRYASYSLSQLIELLPMKKELRENITPDMTIDQIRALKRAEAKTEQKEMPEAKAEQREITEDKNAADEPYKIPYGSGRVVSKVDMDWQVELPRFRNEDERRAWLHDLETRGYWYIDPNVQTEYFRYDFKDGSRLVAKKYIDIESSYGEENACDDIHYYMIFSSSFFEMHKNDLLAGYRNRYIHSEVPVNLIISFLGELQSEEPEIETVEDDGVEHDEGYTSNGYIMKELDSDHLEKAASFIGRKYVEFYKKNGYIPPLFNAKHRKEIVDYAQTLTTGSGSASGIGSAVFFDSVKETEILINNEDIDEESASHLIDKILRVAKPEERKKVMEMLEDSLEHAESA